MTTVHTIHIYFLSLLGMLLARFLPKEICIECIAYSFIFKMIFHL